MHILDLRHAGHPQRGQSRAVRVPALARLASWAGIARQRRALSLLDDRLLDDIGVSRAEAREEAGRWPWQGPEERRLHGR